MTAESLHPLASLAMREAGADGYVLFRRSPDGGLHRVSGSGVPITEELLSGTPGFNVARYTLRAGDDPTGILAFAYANRTVTEAARSRLCRMAVAISQAWQLSETAEAIAAAALEIGRLETELADSKIATRTLGYLEDPPDAGDVVDAIARHVQSVLSRVELNTLLQKRKQELEKELEERQVTSRAKAVLRETAGLSESEAHVHLRMLSRKTRRPIREIALEMVEHERTEFGHRDPFPVR
jgi:AmiR/NasT family two-component response regulator